MPTSKALLKSARLFHLYSGVFFTPALLFFAFTGSVQSLNFHETTRGSNYKPPAILVKLAQLHKKETLVLPEHKAPSPAAEIHTVLQGSPVTHTINPSHLGDHTNQQKHDRLNSKDSVETTSTPPAAIPVPQPSVDPIPPTRRPPNTLPLKIFSFWAGVGLFLSTLTGLYMSYRYARNKTAITVTLAAGLAIPLFLLYLQ